MAVSATNFADLDKHSTPEILPSVSSYEGEWANGIKQGKGQYTFGSGDVFTGTYENNVRHGEGKLVKADGEERTENWKEGKLINFNITKEKKKK